MNDVNTYSAEVMSNDRISPFGYQIRFERKDLVFRSGQLISIHGDSPLEDRSYTIASGEGDACIDVLYKLIPEGRLTPKLVTLKPGDRACISGPYGQFVIRDALKPVVFIATGTGIAPCRSYVRTYGDLNLTVVHGVRREEELFYREELSKYAYYPCVSQGDTDLFKGRVTDLIGNLTVSDGTHFYLCGAYEMIFDVQSMLQKMGVSDATIFTEEYYYQYDL
ncbi:MAG: hypothetical protein KJ626_04480 [Verrucomicrobia bacterium]|nr:hypothetical protein [Verrucomicrobiota bacterium]